MENGSEERGGERKLCVNGVLSCLKGNNIETRRVQITGGSSFMITLPKEWAEKVGLDAKDEVIIMHQADGGLTIYPLKNCIVKTEINVACGKDVEGAPS